MISLWMDVTGTFWRAMTRKLYYIVWFEMKISLFWKKTTRICISPVVLSLRSSINSSGIWYVLCLVLECGNQLQIGVYISSIAVTTIFGNLMKNNKIGIGTEEFYWHNERNIIYLKTSEYTYNSGLWLLFTVHYSFKYALTLSHWLFNSKRKEVNGFIITFLQNKHI